MDYEKIIRVVQTTRPFFVDDTREIKVTVKGKSDFVTQIDVAVQEYLRQELYRLDPQTILIAEEQKRIYIKPDTSYWILDPIDGTQNFIRHVGLSAVSLAYYNKKDLQFGVIYNPFTEETFYAVRGQGAFLNGRAIHVTENKVLEKSLMAIGTSPYDRQFIPQNWDVFQKVYCRCLDVRRSGSAALDLAYVAAGRYDGYFERNLKPWDMAAGIILVQEAGGRVSDYTGKEIQVDCNADICAANGFINEELLRIIGEK